ncbi:transcriptional regulator, Fis family [Anaerococcus hydrogenalis DSM 7454]|uniref:Transcriptional regulator, Fis family n=1 Tax=Anaerococcus hydrogenalis DSM 7454 TaxID=561177 RepID=B6WA98_9FIRM|nr:helix-turn-helix domain-containing protein [Anaerococcus hydrogenalis]EEB35656.1 transcriptional regulator, Fis family [Anaerococcus hydrogenalis DSM 7454]
MLEKDSKIIDYIDEKQTLLIPNTRQRKDDLNLIFNNYIAYYHEKFATMALGVEDYIFDGENLLLNKNLDYLLKKLKNYIFTRNELIVGKDVFTKKIEEGSKKEIFDSKNLEEIEKELILYHLKKEEYNQSKVSEILGISRSTLWRKMKKYKI